MRFNVRHSGVVGFSHRFQRVVSEDCGGGAAYPAVAGVGVVPCLGEGAPDDLVDLLCQSSLGNSETGRCVVVDDPCQNTDMVVVDYD